ncbi:MAG TPA: N-6 DNA methylase, partial [Methylomirabilota bacterium]|nr:N-6 DNA methylase [Methylomirabilota bacterium]
IRSAFSFQNLSVEALAYIYENTLVNPDIRKKLGIHATAYLIAEYIVQQLPIDDLPLEECRFFEPFAGHAPFLIAALRKLRTMLPAGTSIEQRHDYFVRLLSGMEYEAFACEVASYSLILADYPNPNGWRIEKANAFTSPKLDNYLAQANIVLCNPPYERFSKNERQAYASLYSVNKAVEALNRVLARPPKMLGFVLPRTFIDGQRYVEVRRRIAKLYNDISFVALPDNAFNYSDVETVLLIAHGERTAQPTWKFALVDRKDYQQFLLTGQTTWQVQASDSFIESQIYRHNPNFWYTPMHRLWDVLAELPRLESIVSIHRGIEYKSFRKNKSQLVSDVPHEGFAQGLRLTTNGFEPYVPMYFSYFNMDPEQMRRESYKLPWERPKVIANAVRIRSDRWVIASVVDEQGLVCYQNFHGIWPIADIPVEVIAALLNSPVANAFLSTHRSAWHNRKDTITQIPIPKFRPSQIHRIVSLVQEYKSYRKQWDLWLEDVAYLESRCRGIIKQIDAEVLTAYNLPASLELELLKYFQGYERPGPFSPAQLNASPTKRLYTSLMRVEDVRNEVVEVALMNWNPHLTVRFPVFLVPQNLQARLDRGVLLLAEVNVGAKKAEDLSFEAIRLAPELDPDDGLA